MQTCADSCPKPLSNRKVFVLAGPSGVGKGTVVAELKRQYPKLAVAISATTRPPRPGEIDGVHYHFLDDEQFDQILDANGFLEWALVHGKYRYGTLRSEVAAKGQNGDPVLLEIDLAGARQIKVTCPDAYFIFLTPPSREVLLERLLGRGTESAEEQARRMQTADVELAAASEFDEIVINDQLDRAARQLAQILGIA